ncbi:unnamed protein product [Lampetra planeri]
MLLPALTVGLLSCALGRDVRPEEGNLSRWTGEDGGGDAVQTQRGTEWTRMSKFSRRRRSSGKKDFIVLASDLYEKTPPPLDDAVVSMVLLVLTTFQVPLFMMRFGQSNLYRSEDYGKTFTDVTHLINHTFIQTEFGIAISPRPLRQDALQPRRLQRAADAQHHGTGIHSTPPRPNRAPPSSHRLSPAQFDLWLSEDFGATWRKIHDSVCLVRWGPKNSIYFTTNANGSCNDKGALELRKTTDYGRSFHTIATRVYSFVLGGRFVFASIMTGTGTERMIHVSVDGGEVWNTAQLPTVNHEQFYTILAATQDMIFMHVDDPEDSGTGTIYVSDDRGTVFSKSLERHLYTTTGSDTDFTAVTSLRGVYMTSVLTEDGAVETVITFDQGARWQPLQKPLNSHCDTSTDRPNSCRLHIHATYSTSMKLNVPMLPLSQPNAHSHTPVNQIKFSTNEGQCWHTYNFTSDPFHFSGMDSEPGSRSMNISLWGYRNDFSRWVVITIDFRRLLARDCGEGDYVQWLAHSSNAGGLDDGCVLGYKETLLRLRKESVCWNGRDHAVTRSLSPCPCTLDDYHCDFGFYRPENSSECEEQEELLGRPLEFCLNGTTEQLQTSGYRKIPGDRCEGGFQPDRKETDLGRLCTSDFLRPTSLTDSSSTNTAVVVMVVMAILLLSAVAGVWVVKKYVCGGRSVTCTRTTIHTPYSRRLTLTCRRVFTRFLVHRYSVMREHVEANKIEGVDDIDTHYMETGISQYDDSDQDLLE